MVLRQKVVRSETECIVVRDDARVGVDGAAEDDDGRKEGAEEKMGFSVCLCVFLPSL